jgi:hypothetical protein
MAIKYNIYQYLRPSKINTNLDFWFENVPSGNESGDAVLVRTRDFFRKFQTMALCGTISSGYEVSKLINFFLFFHLISKPKKRRINTSPSLTFKGANFQSRMLHGFFNVFFVSFQCCFWMLKSCLEEFGSFDLSMCGLFYATEDECSIHYVLFSRASTMSLRKFKK